MWSKVIRSLGSQVQRLSFRMTSSAAGDKLTGKVALVTASTDGIGLAIARRLAQDGAKVMVSSRKQNNVDAAVKTLKSENLDVAGVVCHVAKSEDRTRLVEETLKTFGAIDVLVSNAGVNPIFGPMMDTTPEAWDKIFDVNVKSTFFLCKEVIPHMEKKSKGSIVIVSSIAAYAPISLLGTYSVSKTALLGMGKAMAVDLAMSNIRVNVVCPGLIQTKFSETLWKNETALEIALKDIPMGRLGKPEDCVGTVSFLASDDSEYMTGESIMVTGGMTARL